MSTTVPMIEVRNVFKAFGPHHVLRGVSLTLGEGESVALFGPNGAGKTTLMRIIATLTRATAGEVWIGGNDARKAGDNIRRYIGVVTHAPLLYDSLTALENLGFYGSMYDVPDRAARIESVLRRVGLWKRRLEPVRTYSRGMVQRLAIARALLHNPPILLLDEPDTGLDQAAAEMLRQVMSDVGTEGRTVLLTTHNLERGLAWADRVLILNDGKVRYEAPAAGLGLAEFQDIYRQHVIG
jgi:heme exporter protein A